MTTDTKAIRALKTKRSKCANISDIDLSNVPDSHETIWLQWGDNGGEDDTWAQNNINDEDIPYVRADLVFDLCDALDAAQAENERLGRDLNMAKYGQPNFAWSIHLEAMADLQAENERLRTELTWYGEQSRLARIISSEGDAGRHALQADGGNRARAALAQKGGE